MPSDTPTPAPTATALLLDVVAEFPHEVGVTVSEGVVLGFNTVVVLFGPVEPSKRSKIGSPRGRLKGSCVPPLPSGKPHGIGTVLRGSTPSRSRVWAAECTIRGVVNQHDGHSGCAIWVVNL